MADAKHVPCGGCGADQFKSVGIPRVSEQAKAVTRGWEAIRVVRCEGCGFYCTDPMVFWNSGALQTLDGAEYFGEESAWWHRQRTQVDPRRRLDAIEGARNQGDKGSLFDIGCGQGYMLEHALRRGWEVWGLEASQVWAKETAARLGVEIRVERVEEANIPEASCDVVFSDSVIEHLHEPATMLHLARRVLRPDGLFYLVTPNADALVNHVRDLLFRLAGSHRAPYIEPLCSPYHVVGFTPHSLRVLVERAGFQIRHLWVRDGGEEWRKEKEGWTSRKFKSVALLPVLVLGEMLGRGTTIEALLVRR